jgi:hypothetical protein
MQITENTHSEVALIYGRGRGVLSPPRLDNSPSTRTMAFSLGAPKRCARRRARCAGASWPRRVTETAFGRKSRNHFTITKMFLPDRNYYHTLVTQKTAGSACCRPSGVLLQSSSSLPVPATMSATVGASTVEAASAMEATATTNARVTSEAARRTACHGAASEPADWTASREAAPTHYCATTSEPTIAGPTVEAATTIEAAASVEASVEPRARSDEDATREPARAVVTVRRARVRVISIVTVLADGSFTDIPGADSNADRNSLCACERRRGQANATNCN